MLPRVDIAGKIQQLYMEGRPVPYLTFMHVFNELLADPAQLVPKEPSDALRENFRAACMCVNVGIIDAEGRDEQRIREFREKVYPLWQAKLPSEDLAKYEDILGGGLRDRRRDEAHEKEEIAAQQATDRSRELLKKLGLVELEEEPVVPGPVPVELPRRVAPPEPAPAELSRRPGAPARFDSIDELCEAIGSGRMTVLYTTREEDMAFARYGLDDLEVLVKLAEVERRQYTVLTLEVGRSGLGEPAQRIDDFAAEMGYLRMADFTYMRRDQEFVYTLKVGPNSTNMACAATEEGAEEEVVRRIQKLHWDLGELLERLRQ